MKTLSKPFCKCNVKDLNDEMMQWHKDMYKKYPAGSGDFAVLNYHYYPFQGSISDNYTCLIEFVIDSRYINEIQ